MPRLGIDDLPRPKRRYRPTLHQKAFETRKSARGEDALRAKGLRSARTDSSPRIDRQAAKRLARKLESASRGGHEASLASSAWLRSVRNRLGGSLWRLVRVSKLKATTFTVLSRKWIFTPEELLSVDPRNLVAAFRQDLLRAGAGGAKGALIAFIHGEHEPDSGYFILHFHGLALGEMIKVVDRLRKRRKFKPVKRGKDGAPAIKRPIQIRRKPLDSLPEPLTYLLKRYWPAKRIGAVGADAKIKRNRRHWRIKEPFHSEVLLWLDRWQLSDITLMLGMRVSRTGFQLTSRSPGEDKHNVILEENTRKTTGVGEDNRIIASTYSSQVCFEVSTIQMVCNTAQQSTAVDFSASANTPQFSRANLRGDTGDGGSNLRRT